MEKVVSPFFLLENDENLKMKLKTMKEKK